MNQEFQPRSSQWPGPREWTSTETCRGSFVVLLYKSGCWCSQTWGWEYLGNWSQWRSRHCDWKYYFKPDLNQPSPTQRKCAENGFLITACWYIHPWTHVITHTTWIGQSSFSPAAKHFLYCQYHQTFPNSHLSFLKFSHSSVCSQLDISPA